MTPGRSLIPPPRWTHAQLEKGRQAAIEDFRLARMREPLSAYIQVFENRHAVFHELLKTTANLKDLHKQAVKILTDEKFVEAVRYLSGPPISEDDLRVVANVPSLAAQPLRANPALAKRLIDTVMLGLDRKRFPWVHDKRNPDNMEKAAAVLASAALVASQRVATTRRNEGKTQQENRVEEVLLAAGLKKVPTREVRTSAEAPRPGEFCRESNVAGRKADILVGLWDSRLMPIECKVSNSSTNSVKRLNNDAAVKAVRWIRDLGENNVVPAAVLSGVYKLHNLIDAQERGLTIFWAHDLKHVTRWVTATGSGHPLQRGRAKARKVKS